MVQPKILASGVAGSYRQAGYAIVGLLIVFNSELGKMDLPYDY